MRKKIKFSIPNWSKAVSVFFFLLLLGAYTQIFAIASPYDPGATLDPECAPGEANCTVNIGGGGAAESTFEDVLTVGSNLINNNSINIASGKSLNFNIDGLEGSEGAFIFKTEVDGSYPQIGASFFDGVSDYSNIYLSHDGYSFRTNNSIEQHYLELNNSGFDYHVNDLSGGGAPQTGIYSELGETGIYGGLLSLDILNNETGPGYVLTDVNGDGYATWEPAGSGPWNQSGSDIYFTSGKVGIGTNTPTAALTTKGFVSTQGSEMISNGTFTDNANGWDLYDSGSYSDGKVTVNYTGAEEWADVSTNVQTESGKKYLLTFTISNLSNDSVYVYFSWNTFFNGAVYTNGTHNVVITSDYTGEDTLFFENWDWNNNSTWTIDDVSMKEVDTVSPSFEVLNLSGNRILSLGGEDDSLFLFGMNAGDNATGAYNSNFLGNNSGVNATGSYKSNFIGSGSGYGASGASGSNFFGEEAGYLATGSYSSNFFGSQAGYESANSTESNFFGNSAGRDSNATNSNFFGSQAGYGSTSSDYSNFLGSNAGLSSINSSYSNFIGQSAGREVSNASYSNFIGNAAGYNSDNSQYSNFLGYYSGYNSLNASNSIFIGKIAGESDTVNNAVNQDFWSILIGYNTNTGGYNNSILLGGSSNSSKISNTKANQFMLAPSVVNMRLRGIDYVLPFSQGATNSVLTNDGSGLLTWEVPVENSPITIPSNNNLISTGLTGSGVGATNASSSIFLGADSGKNATNVTGAIFLGSSSGKNAPSASQSVFIGTYAGGSEVSSTIFGSHFIGANAGSLALNASYSNFIGVNAGYSADNAKNSIFIGTNAGMNDTVDNTTNGTDYSILIGNNSSTGGFENSIALGSYAQPGASNQFVIGSSNGPINTTVWIGTGGVMCTLTTATGGIACSSDSRMKKNITTFEGEIFDKYGDSNNPYDESFTQLDVSSLTSLEKILTITPVTYNWDYEEINIDETHTGFIAQEIKQVFPNLVLTDPTTKKLSLNIIGLTPYIVKAIQEMNLKVDSIVDDSDKTYEERFFDKLAFWLGNKTNQITEFIAGVVRAKDKLCIGEGTEEVCITKDELLEIKKNAGVYTEPVVEERIVEEDVVEEEIVEEEIVTEGEEVVEEEVIETEVVAEDVVEEEAVENIPDEPAEAQAEEAPVI